MVDLSSGDDDSTRPAASFVPRPLDSSKMAQTPPEYQDDAISIADNDQEEQEGDGGSPVVIAEHTTKGDICESSEEEEVGGEGDDDDDSNEDDDSDEGSSDDSSSSSEDTDVIVARIKERRSNKPKKTTTTATATSKKKHKKKKQTDSPPKKKVKNWCLAEKSLLLKAHHAASESPSGTDMTSTMFWRSVSEAFNFLKKECFENYPDDEAFWGPKCAHRTASQCKRQFGEGVMRPLQRFIALLEQDRKSTGTEGPSGGGRPEWYLKISKRFQIYNKKKDGKMGPPFKLYSFEQTFENEPIDMPRYAMEHYARFKNLGRPPPSSSTATTTATATAKSTGKEASFPARPKGRNQLKTDAWTKNKRKSLIGGEQAEKAKKKGKKKGKKIKEVKRSSTKKKKKSPPSSKTSRELSGTTDVEDDVVSILSLSSDDSEEIKKDPFLSMFSSNMTTIFKDMAGVSEKKATIEATIERSRLQREANAEKVRVHSQIATLVDKLSNPNLDFVGKQVLEKVLASSMLLLESLNQQAHPGFVQAQAQPVRMQYPPTAAQYPPPAWAGHQPMTTPVRGEVAAAATEVTPANEACV
jgi:hypothetical protein